MTKICTMSGSLRAGSYNRMLSIWIGDRLRARGHEVTDIDLRAHEMPLFDEDLEAMHGTPGSVKSVHGVMSHSDAVVLVTPEYNGSLSYQCISTGR